MCERAIWEDTYIKYLKSIALIFFPFFNTVFLKIIPPLSLYSLIK